VGYAKVGLGAACGLVLGLTTSVSAQRYQGPGVTDTVIRIGHTTSSTGGLASLEDGRSVAFLRYFDKINVEGGINGRRLELIIYNDGSDPERALENARRLVEVDDVLLILHPIGTPQNLAMREYMNERQVPQLFTQSNIRQLGDHANFPWTMTWYPPVGLHARAYAEYVTANFPDARIGMLYRNDAFGAEFKSGVLEGLGGTLEVLEERTFSLSDPEYVVDQFVADFQAAEIDVLFDFANPAWARRVLRVAAETGWKPLHFLYFSGLSVLAPAGLENTVGSISSWQQKEPSDPIWHQDADYQEVAAFMSEYYPEGDPEDAALAYIVAQALVHVLVQCGEDFSRANVMRQAANLKDLELGMLLPGVKINTSPTDYFPLEQIQLERFNGVSLEFFGPVIDGSDWQ
jgi:branched-chain amino acid transport system substrate-binding protein